MSEKITVVPKFGLHHDYRLDREGIRQRTATKALQALNHNASMVETPDNSDEIHIYLAQGVDKAMAVAMLGQVHEILIIEV